ncbi:hypothetical protein [Leptolyngbya sp. 'hensonii']|uniref:hypothetical protein n=1 Tax=Leptolyngbya sp. 'hensonii' TaxID=1922337 RepID=UPI000A7C9766|nr:hypothetical protein [Leptolyngbya sp. 'hensonii']
MASIILSFVGQQDPFAKTETEGSIVTLVHHLLANHHIVKRVFLLHTDGTQQNAIDTKDWLLSEIKNLKEDTVSLLAASEAFSQDPINQSLAVQEARQAVEQAWKHQTVQDTLEFNGSSGTPAMKSCWAILQATGYAPHSHVWQVRNPKELQPGQARVFRDDVNILKHEFDLKVIKRQVQDYNYSGALVSFQASYFNSELVMALLNYGHCRMAFDFDRADQAIQPYKAILDQQWFKEIAALRQRSYTALARECYLNGQTKLKNREYAEFLVLLSSFQETSLRALIEAKIPVDLRTGKDRTPEDVWRDLAAVEGGTLMAYLRQCKTPKGEPLRLTGFLNAFLMMAILERYPEYLALLPILKDLKKYIDDRNDLVHRLAGVSEIQDLDTLQKHLKTILKAIAPLPGENPFDLLNQHICSLLDQAMQSSLS